LQYFSDVADALATAKLDFATSASPLDAVDAVNISAEGAAFLKGIENLILRDQMRDYFVNQQLVAICLSASRQARPPGRQGRQATGDAGGKPCRADGAGEGLRPGTSSGTESAGGRLTDREGV
jgi:predicted methyltransferase family protein